VDKSRSKEVGGTGLGLSIVKHAVMIHNGRIEVKSAVGEGSEFIVTIPNHPKDVKL
jgi:two-component system phosphate regulon sensor histidine kinase PhoR